MMFLFPAYPNGKSRESVSVNYSIPDWSDRTGWGTNRGDPASDVRGAPRQEPFRRVPPGTVAAGRGEDRSGSRDRNPRRSFVFYI